MKKPPKKVVPIKRFNAWTKLKRKLDTSSIPAGYKEREVWWISLGHNVGVEEDGKGEFFNRPVLIIRGFNRYQFWGVPLSTTEKTGVYYYPFVCNGKVSTALLSQMRVFDTRRLMNKYGMIGKKDFAEIKLKLIDFLS